MKADLFGDALAVEDVVDLAHGDDVLAGGPDQIQHGGAGGLEAEVVTVGGALEVGGAVPHKGPGNDPAHPVGAGQHLPGDLADAVQFGHRHQRLVGRHLKDAVGAGVDDERVLGHGLLAVVLQHLGAGVGLVAQHLVAGPGLKGGDQFGREPLREGGQGLGADHAGDLPVADGGVLAHALLLQAGIGPDGRGGRAAGGHPVDVEQAQPAHVGAVEGGVPGNGAEGVGPLVPKGRRVGLGPNTEAVQHDQKYTFCHSI